MAYSLRINNLPAKTFFELCLLKKCKDYSPQFRLESLEFRPDSLEILGRPLFSPRFCRSPLTRLAVSVPLPLIFSKGSYFFPLISPAKRSLIVSPAPELKSLNLQRIRFGPNP